MPMICSLLIAVTLLLGLGNSVFALPAETAAGLTFGKTLFATHNAGARGAEEVHFLRAHGKKEAPHPSLMAPTAQLTGGPTPEYTRRPSPNPSPLPTHRPSPLPTESPATKKPSKEPTAVPSAPKKPSIEPTAMPSAPTEAPTFYPTVTTPIPTVRPTPSPSAVPTVQEIPDGHLEGEYVMLKFYGKETEPGEFSSDLATHESKKLIKDNDMRRRLDGTGDGDDYYYYDVYSNSLAEQSYEDGDAGLCRGRGPPSFVIAMRTNVCYEGLLADGKPLTEPWSVMLGKYTSDDDDETLYGAIGFFKSANCDESKLVNNYPLPLESCKPTIKTPQFELLGDVYEVTLYNSTADRYVPLNHNALKFETYADSTCSADEYSSDVSVAAVPVVEAKPKASFYAYTINTCFSENDLNSYEFDCDVTSGTYTLRHWDSNAVCSGEPASDVTYKSNKCNSVTSSDFKNVQKVVNFNKLSSFQEKNFIEKEDPAADNLQGRDIRLSSAQAKRKMMYLSQRKVEAEKVKKQVLKSQNDKLRKFRALDNKEVAKQNTVHLLEEPVTSLPSTAPVTAPVTAPARKTKANYDHYYTGEAFTSMDDLKNVSNEFVVVSMALFRGGCQKYPTSDGAALYAHSWCDEEMGIITTTFHVFKDCSDAPFFDFSQDGLNQWDVPANETDDNSNEYSHRICMRTNGVDILSPLRKLDVQLGNSSITNKRWAVMRYYDKQACERDSLVVVFLAFPAGDDSPYSCPRFGGVSFTENEQKYYMAPTCNQITYSVDDNYNDDAYYYDDGYDDNNNETVVDDGYDDNNNETVVDNGYDNNNNETVVDNGYDNNNNETVVDNGYDDTNNETVVDDDYYYYYDFDDEVSDALDEMMFLPLSTMMSCDFIGGPSVDAFDDDAGKINGDQMEELEANSDGFLVFRTYADFEHCNAVPEVMASGVEYGYRLDACFLDRNDFGFSYKYFCGAGYVYKFSYNSLDCNGEGNYSTEILYTTEQVNTCMANTLDNKAGDNAMKAYCEFAGPNVAMLPMNKFDSSRGDYKFRDYSVVLNFGAPEGDEGEESLDACNNVGNRSWFKIPDGFPDFGNFTLGNFTFGNNSFPDYFDVPMLKPAAFVKSYEAYPLGSCVSFGSTSKKASGCMSDGSTNVVEYSDGNCGKKVVDKKVSGKCNKMTNPFGKDKDDKFSGVKQIQKSLCKVSNVEYETAVPYGFKGMMPKCSIARPALTKEPSFAPTYVPRKEDIVVIEMDVKQEITGLTVEQFDEDAQYVFKKSVVKVLGLPVDDASDVDNAVRINDITSKTVARRTARRRLTETLVVDYTIVVADIAAIGFSNPAAAGAALTLQLVSAVSDGSFTKTLQAIAVAEGNTDMASVTASEKPAVSEVIVIPPPAPKKKEEEKPKVPVGAIVGGVIGGILVLAAGIFVYMKYYGKKNESPNMKSITPVQVPDSDKALN